VAVIAGDGIGPEVIAAAGANLHRGRAGLFEPVHGSAPEVIAQGVRTPDIGGRATTRELAEAIADLL
jgi:isocitrate/isopropylmalate dehydrogenase